MSNLRGMSRKCPALLALAFAGGAIAEIPWVLPSYASPTDTPYTVAVDTAVVYGKAATATGDIDLSMDVYQPAKLSNVASKAAILFIHGGSFVDGGRADMAPLCQAFAEKGLVAFTIDYRMVGNNPPVQLSSYVLSSPTYLEGQLTGLFPKAEVLAGDAAYIDSKAAIRYVHAHADSLGIDTSNIFIGGASAGAIAALGAGETGDTTYVADSLGHAIRPENNPKASMTVRGVVDWSGGLFFDLWQLKAGNPPIVIYHGTLDSVVPFLFAEQLKHTADSVGLPCEMDSVPGGGHVPETGAAAGDVLAVSTSFVMRLIQTPAAIASRAATIPTSTLRCIAKRTGRIEIENVPASVRSVEVLGIDGRNESSARPAGAGGTWIAGTTRTSGVRLLRLVRDDGTSMAILVPMVSR
jgi:acetyl esterase